MTNLFLSTAFDSSEWISTSNRGIKHLTIMSYMM